LVPGKFVVIKRPLAGDFVEKSFRTPLDMIYEFTVSWEGFTDLDIFSGGDSTPTEFDKELFVLWIKDHPEYWNQISAAIDSVIGEHDKRVAEAEKK
jgi:hypothetical protein